MKKYKVVIVGATGLVGNTFIKVLEEYNLPIKELKLLASEKSEGKKLKFKGEELTVHTLKAEEFDGFDVALFSAGSDVSLKFAPIAIEKGLYVIDNSSAFRNDPLVPLIVPEVNIMDYKLNKLIANPNCSTIQCMLPLKALDDKFGVNKVYYQTYQAVSGSGMKGKNDLINTRNGLKPSFYPYDISNTCIPEIDKFMDNNYTKEEMKMVNETRKILHKNDLAVAATCVRVPVLNSHAVSMIISLDKDFTLDEVRDTLRNFKNIVLVDDLKNHIYPTSIMANNTDKVYCGRIRRDLTNEKGLMLYTTADNIRKGAASNAVEILEELIKRDLI